MEKKRERARMRMRNLRLKRKEENNKKETRGSRKFTPNASVLILDVHDEGSKIVLGELRNGKGKIGKKRV